MASLRFTYGNKEEHYFSWTERATGNCGMYEIGQIELYRRRGITPTLTDKEKLICLKFLADYMLSFKYRGIRALLFSAQNNQYTFYQFLTKTSRFKNISYATGNHTNKQANGYHMVYALVHPYDNFRDYNSVDQLVASRKMYSPIKVTSERGRW